MELILPLCALVLLLWGARMVKAQALLHKQRQVINATHTALSLWQAELEEATALMGQRHGHVMKLIEQTQAANEQAMLELGRGVAQVVGEVHQACGERVLAVTVKHVSTMTTARMLDGMKRCTVRSTP